MTSVDERVDTSTIEHLDFEYVPPCEHREHMKRHVAGDPAKYVVRSRCPSCRRGTKYLLCASGWRGLMRAPVADCSQCGHQCHASEALTIVEVLR